MDPGKVKTSKVLVRLEHFHGNIKNTLSISVLSVWPCCWFSSVPGASGCVQRGAARVFAYIPGLRSTLEQLPARVLESFIEEGQGSGRVPGIVVGMAAALVVWYLSSRE